MTPRTSMTLLLAAAWSLGCGDTPPRPFDEEPPKLLVRLPAGTAQPELVTVGFAQAPVVQFGASIQPSNDHIKVVTSSTSGTVVRVDSTSHVGDRATVGAITNSQRRSFPIIVPTEGLWEPRRAAGQVVLLGDTLGLLLEHGYWLAVGQVPEIEHGILHRGDLALVHWGDARGHTATGHVENVRHAGPNGFYAEVAVEFAYPENLMKKGWWVATVDVIPTDAVDSMPSVPASAVVRLQTGNCVFIPTDSGDFEARFVLEAATKGDVTVIRSGLTRGMKVAHSQLQMLAAMAHDSLAARAQSARNRR